MDDVDARIIRVLRGNGRITNSDLAAEVGLSPSACLRRLRLLERSGVIRGYTVVLNTPAREDVQVVLTQITLDRQTEEYFARFEDAIRRHPEITDCYLMTGGSDYLLKIEVASTADYERFHKEVLSRLPGVARIQSSFSIRTVIGGRPEKV